MHCNKFTLIELIAVIIVSSFLVAMTVQVMKSNPVDSQVYQLGSACSLSTSKAAKIRKNILVEFDGVTFKASYQKNGSKEIFKEFKVSDKVEAKMEKGDAVITSYVLTPEGTVNGGGEQVTFKIRDKKTGGLAKFFTVNGFTSRVFYYGSDGSQVTEW